MAIYSPCDTAEAVGCPIRKSSDQSLLAAPQGLTQPVTSFIASQCQGIHQMPFRHLITLNHTQGAGDQRSDVRDQIPDDPNNLGTLQRPAYEIRSIHNGSWILFKSWRGLVTRTSTEQHQTTEQTEHAIVRRLVSKEDRPCPGAVNRARQGTFFTSSSQCQRTQTQSSELRVQVSD